MPTLSSAASPWPVHLTAPALTFMADLSRTLFRLSTTTAYQQRVLPLCPPSAHFNPGHHSVMMGYDFHLTDDGPKLIEINTNAGGTLPAWIAYARYHHLPEEMPDPVKAQLLQTFREEWRLFGGDDKPETVAIIDENPRQQHMYDEMTFFAELFERSNHRAVIIDPGALQQSKEGLYVEGRKIDLIYNRHTDFYLETPAMAPVLNAYLKRQVLLTPNPHTYGLLADKRRLIQLSDAAFRHQLPLADDEEQQLEKGLLPCRLLADWALDDCWHQRKGLVFKPVAHFGGKGVLLGKSMSRKRFEALPAQETLVQSIAPPSLTPAGEAGEMKTDFRLFMYRDRLLGVTARLYQGQLTNLRTEGGGFAPVTLTLEEESP